MKKPHRGPLRSYCGVKKIRENSKNENTSITYLRALKDFLFDSLIGDEELFPVSQLLYKGKIVHLQVICRS